MNFSHCLFLDHFMAKDSLNSYQMNLEYVKQITFNLSEQFAWNCSQCFQTSEQKIQLNILQCLLVATSIKS